MNTRFSSLAALVVTFASFMLGGCAADGEPTSAEGEAIAEGTSGRANDVATSERANPVAPSRRANDVATSERANPTNGGAAGVARGDTYEESLAVRMVEHANVADAGGPMHTQGITWGYYYCDAMGIVTQSGILTPDAAGYSYTADRRSGAGTCCHRSLLWGCIESL